MREEYIRIFKKKKNKQKTPTNQPTKKDKTQVFHKCMFWSALYIFCFQMLLFFCWCMPTWKFHMEVLIAESAWKQLTASSLHLLSGEEHFQIFRNLLPNQSTGEWPSPCSWSPYNLEHLLIFHQFHRVKTVTPQQCCVCISSVSLFEVKYFHSSKNVLILHLMGKNSLASAINEN